MTMNETDLTKGQIRKLNALRKSIGDTLADEAFTKWLEQEKSGKREIYKPDPVADLLSETLKPLLKKKGLNLGRYGYAIKRAKGKGAKGIIVNRIEKTAP